MEDYLYVLFNTLSKRYEGVMQFASDGMALHRLTSKVDHKEYDLCRIGSINLSTGEVKPESPVRLIWEKEEELPKTKAE